MFQKQTMMHKQRNDAKMKTTFTKSRKDNQLTQVMQDHFSNTMNINASNASLKKLLQKSASKAVLRNNVDTYHLAHFNPSFNNKKQNYQDSSNVSGS